MIDHINGNCSDNKISNLRETTPRKNQNNQRRHRDGWLQGTSLHKKSGLWRARTKINGKDVSLGYFKTQYDAHKKYMDYINGI